ncbi:MAG: hypothetical protein SYC29_07595 [Planctomycetota bacterium]|nr:hypothetical protein [Planctomycetota bacterium]
MNHAPSNAPPDDPRPEDISELDLLINRIIDGEAGEADRRRFDELARSEPDLWRRVALRQQDAILLTEQMGEATAGATGTELPRRWLMPRRLSWPLALAGWAAVIIVAVTWSLSALVDRELAPRNSTPMPVQNAPLTAEEHLQRYLEAPYVLADLQPDVLEVDQLSDGRVAVRFVRRIEEIAFLDPQLQLPVDEEGALTKDPVRLRESEPEVGLSD